MRYLAIALLAIGMAACTNDSTSPNGNVRGTYDLQTIQGQPLPVQFQNGTQIFSDQLTLSSNGSYEEDADYSDTGPIIQDTGTYSVNNNLVSFFSDNGSFNDFNGSVSGNVLTITFPQTQGDVWVYRRE